jgi:hypothetical protein
VSQHRAAITVAHSPLLWKVITFVPGMLGFAAIGAAVAALPLALGQHQPLFLLLILLAVPGFELLRPVRAAWIASRGPAIVIIEPDRAIITMPGILSKPLIVSRRHVHSVWLTTSAAARPSKAVPEVSGFYAMEGLARLGPVILVVTSTLLDTGKIPVFGLGWLKGRGTAYVGPRRHALLRGILISAVDFDVALAAFADWSTRFGDPPDDLRRWLAGPPLAVRMRHLFRAPPGLDAISLESEPDVEIG